jgi:uncharacterized protein
MPTLDRAHPFFAFFAEAPAPIRVAVFFIVWIGIWLPIAVPLAISVKWKPFNPLEISQKLPLVFSLYLLAPLVLWALAWADGHSFSAYGLPWDISVLKSLGTGMGLGVVGLAILFGVETLLGWISWQKENWRLLGSALLPTLFLGLLISLIEELIFRGFLPIEIWNFVNQFAAGYGTFAAFVFSSLIFAVLHLVWEGRENIPQLPGLWLMGIVLYLACLADCGRLGLPWGLHAGWIWGMASLDSAQLIRYTGRAPQWVTGLGGKVLAGLMGFLFLMVTGVVLLRIFLATLSSCDVNFGL